MADAWNVFLNPERKISILCHSSLIGTRSVRHTTVTLVAFAGAGAELHLHDVTSPEVPTIGVTVINRDVDPRVQTAAMKSVPKSSTRPKDPVRLVYFAILDWDTLHDVTLAHSHWSWGRASPTRYDVSRASRRPPVVGIQQSCVHGDPSGSRGKLF